MSFDNSHVKEKIRKFIIENYLAGLSQANLGDDDSFLKKGIIDSIGVIELTHFIQNEFPIKIEVKEIVPENFDTVNNLERYISIKIKGLKT